MIRAIPVFKVVTVRDGGLWSMIGYEEDALAVRYFPHHAAKPHVGRLFAFASPKAALEYMYRDRVRDEAGTGRKLMEDRQLWRAAAVDVEYIDMLDGAALVADDSEQAIRAFWDGHTDTGAWVSAGRHTLLCESIRLMEQVPCEPTRADPWHQPYYCIKNRESVDLMYSQ